MVSGSSLLRTMAVYRISSFFRAHAFHYSTLHSPKPKPGSEPIINYLVDSLQFTKQDAITISSKTRLKSTINSDLVLTTFKNYGFNPNQIRQIISSSPKILSCKAHKTLEPKIRFFQQLGLSGSDLFKLVKTNPNVFRFGLHTRIIPFVNLLKKLLGNDENVVHFINKAGWLACSKFLMQRVSTNVLMLQKLGLCNERIVKFMLINPSNIMANPKLLESKVSYVEDKLRVSRDVPGFLHSASAVLYVSDAEIERRMQVFRSFGWSDSDISLLIRNQPYCLTKSEGKIREKLVFLMKDVGYTPEYLISCSSFFTYSLSKRVMPRYKMLRILKEKKLVKDKPTLTSVVTYSELKFLAFLRRFEDDVPGISEIYMDTVRRVG